MPDRHRLRRQRRGRTHTQSRTLDQVAEVLRKLKQMQKAISGDESKEDPDEGFIHVGNVADVPIIPEKDDQDDGQARVKRPAIDKDAGSGSGDPQ